MIKTTSLIVLIGVVEVLWGLHSPRRQRSAPGDPYAHTYAIDARVCRLRRDGIVGEASSLRPGA